jgi:hypothetical protein
MNNFALIDYSSGAVWWVGEAASPEAACAAATLETGMEVAEYESVYRLAYGDDGYLVYAARDGFDVTDGQDQEQIDAVSALPLIGRYARVRTVR